MNLHYAYFQAAVCSVIVESQHNLPMSQKWTEILQFYIQGSVHCFLY